MNLTRNYIHLNVEYYVLNKVLNVKLNSKVIKYEYLNACQYYLLNDVLNVILNLVDSRITAEFKHVVSKFSILILPNTMICNHVFIQASRAVCQRDRSTCDFHVRDLVCIIRFTATFTNLP